MAERKVFCVALLLVLGSIYSDCAMLQDPGGSVPTRPAAELFRKILPEIKSKTRVPILLPSELPAPIKENDVQLVVGTGEADKYEVGLYYDEPGTGANFVGHFAGEAGGSPYGLAKKVALSNRISGYFRARTCGGSCSPSQIEWSQNGVLYTLQLNLSVSTVQEEERAVVSAANSSIQGGAR